MQVATIFAACNSLPFLRDNQRVSFCFYFDDDYGISISSEYLSRNTDIIPSNNTITAFLRNVVASSSPYSRRLCRVSSIPLLLSLREISFQTSPRAFLSLSLLPFLFFFDLFQFFFCFWLFPKPLHLLFTIQTDTRLLYYADRAVLRLTCDDLTRCFDVVGEWS